MSSNKLLASLAVFRSLDKKGKKVNAILSEFLIDVIKSKQLYQFTATEIGSLLEKMYDFQIPDAVIRTALKKINFVTVQNHQYTISDSSQLQDYSLDKQQKEILDRYEKILQKLFNYIESKKTSTLTVEDKTRIEKEFSSFILDNASNNGYSDFISAYIIDNKENHDFMDTLGLIKEGVILYTGLKFNPRMNFDTSWKSNLTIYINTEIIFHLAGYDGSLYKQLFDDFQSLVKEANRNQKYIKLKYFSETKKEIESFFYAAEKIILGDILLNTTSSAMKMLVNGSKDTVAILAKKARLFELLDTYGIQMEESDDVYLRDNFQYNISEQKIIEKYVKEFDGKYDVEHIQDMLKKLNYISIKRGERENNNFDNIGYIFLTENSKINAIAWDDDIKNKGDVPLTTNLQFITNKLWFKLNKGFGGSEYPVSFKIITKAQTILASHLSDTLSREYNELKKRVENGEMTEKIAMAVLYELRSRSKMPEDLYDSDMTSVLDTINEKKLDDYALQHESIKEEVKSQEEKNKQLALELEKKEKEKMELKNEKDKTVQDKERLELIVEQTKREKEQEKNRLLRELLSEKEKKYLQFKSEQKSVYSNAGRIAKRERFAVFIAYFVVLIFVAYRYINWDSFEKWAWVASLILPVAGYVFKGKIKILHDLIRNRKSKILNDLYIKHKVDTEEMKELSRKIDEIKDQISYD